MLPKKDPIPENASREELAQFWDTHDLTDYLDELQAVKVHPLPLFDQGITVRFDLPTITRLRAQAHKVGVGTTTLIRMWVKERLQVE
ncbi:MAG: hypothetical protein JNJ61_20595 [Anaerolineae bacterium]|nr:hypothetical protein [Anaerolineae bacterium]